MTKDEPIATAPRRARIYPMANGRNDRAPLDRVLLSTPVVTVAQFRVAPSDPRFGDSGPIQRHIFVFPRKAVRIRHAGSSAFVADPNMVTFYNEGQVYSRAAVDGEGDFCDWFAIEPRVLAEIASHFGTSPDAFTAPFSITHAPVDSDTFLLARRVVHEASHRGRRAGSGPAAALDRLGTEEAALELLCRLLRAWRTPPRHRPASRRERLVERAKDAIASDLGQPLALDEIARRAGVSVFHLCRTFRRATGLPIHQYRMSLRLRRAFDLLACGRADIASVAFEVGFTSHSHFTSYFHRAFGRPPSDLRRTFSFSSTARSSSA